jgi:hypothetical protein
MKIAPDLQAAPKRKRTKGIRKAKDSLAKLSIAGIFVPLGVEVIRLIEVLVKTLAR